MLQSGLGIGKNIELCFEWEFIHVLFVVRFRILVNSSKGSAAEIHIAMIRELSKQDANLIVLNHEGKSQVNIHKSFGEEKYKEYFKPREKLYKNGTVQVSVAHYVLTKNKSFNKALLLQFLKKHNVHIFFNQKDGLEHFAAISVLF
jgi:hypothetical protein